jgi:transcriptional regulator with XRE-family HTH domain
MSKERGTATLLPVAKETLGQQIRRRRMGYGMSVRKFMAVAGVDRATITKAEADDPSVTDLKYDQLIKALDDFEYATTSEAEDVAEAGAASETPASDRIVFRIKGLRKAGDVEVEEVWLEGPRDAGAELEAYVERLLGRGDD